MQATTTGSWTPTLALTWQIILLYSHHPPHLLYIHLLSLEMVLLYLCCILVHFGSSVIPTHSTPLHLNNVVISPHLIKKLIFIHALTCDNYVSITFEPFCFSIKDFKMGTILLRCDSTCELHPLRSSSNKASWSRTPLSFAWLNHLGHGQLHRLLPIFYFNCVKSDNHSCSACRVSKNVKLSFYESSNTSLFSFHLLHCDVWTSHVVSNSGFKFYLVILDDFSHFTWTFPLRQKSDMLPTLISFHAFIHTV
jgi:hypothetical protein